MKTALTGRAKLMTVAAATKGKAFEFSAPRPLFETSYVGGPIPGYFGNYVPRAPSPDGQR